MKLFTHRPGENGGEIHITNQGQSVTIPLADFIKIESDYALPEGYVQREYNPPFRHDLISVGGVVKQGAKEWEAGELYFTKISQYQQVVAQKQEEDTVNEILPLDITKERKLKELDNNCQQSIIEGFTSEALSTTHHYSGTEESQTNLIGAVVLAQQTKSSVPITCTEIATGSKLPRLHTSAQLSTVFKDGSSNKIAKIARYHELKAQVLVAQSVEEVKAIEWTFEKNQ